MSTIDLVANLNLLEKAIAYWQTLQNQAIDFGDEWLFNKSRSILASLIGSYIDYANELELREA